MRFDAVLSALSHGRLHVQSSTLKKAIYERSSDMVKIYNDIKSWYWINLKPHGGEYIVKLAQFLVQYIELVESLLLFIGALGRFLRCIREPP